jgi:hypothetical protein
MRRLCLGLGVLGALVCVLPGEGAPTPPAKTKDLDASLLPAGVFAGRLLSVPDSDRMFTVAVAYQEVQPNPNARPHANLARDLQQIARLQAALRTSRNPGPTLLQLQRAVLQLQQQVAQAQLNSVRVVNATHRLSGKKSAGSRHFLLPFRVFESGLGAFLVGP